MLQTVVNKPRKMRDVDNALKDKFEATPATIEKTLRSKIPEEGDMLAETFRRETWIHKLQKQFKAFLVRRDTNVPGVLHKGRRHTKHKVDGHEKSTVSVPNVKTPMAKSQKLKAEIGSKLKQELLALSRGKHAKKDKKQKQIKGFVDTHIEGMRPLGCIVEESLAPVIKPPEGTDVYLGDTAKGTKQAVHVQLTPAPEPDALHNESNRLPGNQKFSVLVLGKMQSGKTAFIEHAKKYANPESPINQAVLGNGTFSKTDRTHTVIASSALPSYQMYDKSSGDKVDFHPAEGADVEDIRDWLYTRDDNIGLRPAPENLSSQSMDFEFLDTPGLCNHQDKDVAQAVDIIGRIFATRSFNLILIVVSIQDPLGDEQLLALEYYSKVLDGLHSNIAFLYTHADCGTYLHPNKAQQSVLANKTRMLSRIFQGPTAEDSDPYPSFTIGLTEKKLPVVQCLMQNTLREILQLAVSNLPALIDTNHANIDRIKNIDHPSYFDDLLRDSSLSRIYGQPRPQVSVSGSPLSESGGSNLQNMDTVLVDTQSGKLSPIGLVQGSEPGRLSSVESAVQKSADPVEETLEGTTETTHNVVLLGNPQVGKSTVVEFFRVDADPTRAIDQSRRGDGFLSKTQFIERFHLRANLVPCKVLETDTGRIHDLRNLGERIIEEGDYQALLQRHMAGHALTHDLNMPPPDLVKYNFRLVDTPGLNNTGGRSVAIAQDIVQEIISNPSINLILIVISAKSPITMETRIELQYYAKVLQGVHSNIAFLYTNTDYADCHRSNTKHHLDMQTRHTAYSKIFRGVPDDAEGVDLFPYFTIELEQKKRPFVQGMTQNTLKEILRFAVSTPPARVDTSSANIERIMAIQHPKKVNQELRRVNRVSPVAVAQAATAAAPAEETGNQSPATFMASVFSNAEIEGFSCDFSMDVDGMDI
ncbi:hypothetical protein BG006_008075 [Podila minutissima]|uniref:G domain-containing protein n=1 Tax=Podila minutissima TaxID=64525 RepID=A0A9P5VQL8_9FUNG|nr:hypothetical protein BG006_008075 [Podila minutissima]